MALRNLARHRVLLVLVVLLIAGLFLITAGRLRAAPHPGLAPGCAAAPQAQAITASVAAAVASAPGLAGHPGTQWRVESVCQQGVWAYAFVKGYTSSGAPLPGPSEVALVQQTALGWQTILPTDGAAYNQALAALPDALLPQAARPMLSVASAGAAPSLSGPSAGYFSGFSLPFPAGQYAYVHWHWYPALDFTIQSPGIVRAAKDGIAVFVKGSSTVACGDPPPNWTCWMYANAIVIQSGPKEYAWYMHFAPNTIPEWLHEGVHVPAGADIGTEGETGWALLPHLHFMVSSWYACCAGSGDARFPIWPAGTILTVDFNEYTWNEMPYTAVSQNGSPEPNNPPPAPAATQGAAPAANHVPPTATPPPPAPAAPAPAAGVSPCSNPYTVQPGDYLIRIAANCQVNEAALVAANPGLTPNLIYPGQLLNLPLSPGGQSNVTAAPATQAPTAGVTPAAGGGCSGTHIVALGESLFQISRGCSFSFSWQQLATANGIAYPYLIYAGQSLQFP